MSIGSDGAMVRPDVRGEAAATATSPRDTSFIRWATARRRRIARRRLIRGAIGIAAVLALWEFMAKAYDLEIILPTPFTVAQDVAKMLLLQEDKWLYGPTIYEHLGASLLRALIGFGLAAVIALPLGLLVGRVAGVRETVGPVVKILYPIPGVAWIPLAILWFGLSDQAVIFTVFMGAVFPLYFNTEGGARQIDPFVVDAGRCFGARGPNLLVRVILPATLPYVIVGLRVAIGNAWRMIVAAEMFASQTGIGFLLTESRFQFRAADLMSAMVLVSVVGYLTEKVIVGTIERRTTEKWEVAAA
ncbi:MAG: ABC transporter permease [Chloroflexota bacterium]|nr:ABC transporter permease [Chloroflexota bacterium]